MLDQEVCAAWLTSRETAFAKIQVRIDGTALADKQI